MADPVETVACDSEINHPESQTEVVTVPHPQTSQFWHTQHGEVLDDEWAIEFDRRLAAWEAESVGAILDLG